MRLAYLDDSGTGKIDVDPHAVIGGVIVNADRQFKAIEAYLAAMAEQYLSDYPNSYFHAKDLWHGGGFFPREKYPDKWKRRIILLEIIEMVKHFDLPVVFGAYDRRELANERPNFCASDQIAAALAISAFQATVLVERYMRRYRSQVAMIFYENNNTSKKIIREVHNYWRNPHDNELLDHEQWRPYLPFQKIVDPCHTAEKTESSILQIADAIAFAIGRKLKNAEDCDYLFQPIERNLIVRRHEWGTGPRNRLRKGSGKRHFDKMGASPTMAR